MGNAFKHYLKLPGRTGNDPCNLFRSPGPNWGFELSGFLRKWAKNNVIHHFELLQSNVRMKSQMGNAFKRYLKLPEGAALFHVIYFAHQDRIEVSNFRVSLENEPKTTSSTTSDCFIRTWGWNRKWEMLSNIIWNSREGPAMIHVIYFAHRTELRYRTLGFS